MGSANIYGPASPGANFPAYGGATVLRETTLNSIERIDDKDTYRIRATSTGTTEIRINTTQLTNGYMEYVANGLERVTDPMTGMPDGPADYEEFTTDDIGDRATYDSLLDATIRIYNADFEQIAFNDDSGVVRGDTQLDEVGTLLEHHFGSAMQKRLCDRGLAALFEHGKGTPGLMLPLAKRVFAAAPGKTKIEHEQVEDVLRRWNLA